MTMLKKLISVTQGLSSGVEPDKHPQAGFIWKDSRNVQSTVSGARKMKGWTKPLTSPDTDTPRGMGQLLDAALTRLFWGTIDAIHSWDGTTVTTPGTGFTGNLSESGTTPASTWSMQEWGAWQIATNGVDTPQIFKGASFASLAGTPPTTAEIVLTLGPHALLFNTNVAGNGYNFSHEDDVEDWVGGVSGSNIIRDFDSDIVCAVPLADRIAVYGKEKLAVLSYLGSPLYFGHKTTINSGIGAVSKKSVVAVRGVNYGLGPNGFFRTDGVRAQDIDLGTVRDTFLADVNSAHLTKINAWHNEVAHEVIWYYPSGTSTEPDKGITYNYITKAWHFLDHGRTASTEQRVFAFPYTAQSDNSILQMNDGEDDAANPITAYVQSHPFPFERQTRNEGSMTLEDVYKYIDAIKLYMANFNSVGIKIRVGVQDELDDNIVFTDVLQLSDPATPIFPMISGRWITLRVESAELGDTWELQGFEAHGKLIGGPH